MKMNFKGRNVLITGSSMGLGRELSKCFAQDGANLALTDHPIQKERLETWTDELQRVYGIKTWTFCIDLTECDGPERLHEEVTDTAGDIHILVNNAGLCWYGNFYNMPLDRLEKTVLLNCMAYAKLSVMFLSPMIYRNDGGILNISSISAFQPGPMFALYAGTKAFTQNLTEAIRIELPKKSKVIISTLNPPFMNTHMIEDAGIPHDVPIKVSLGFTSVAKIARQGFHAFKSGKDRYVPGLYNRILYLWVSKYTPHGMLCSVARALTRM
jgi:hypothetical protein